jgi:hypothetical protein
LNGAKKFVLVNTWDAFLISNGVNQGNTLLPLLLKFVFVSMIVRPREIERNGTDQLLIGVWW